MNPVMMQAVLIVSFVAFMYFVMIRPNKKRQQEMTKMRDSIKNGDSVITIGGIKGKVIKVSEKEVTIETSSDKNKIVFLKTAIHSVVSKSDKASEKVEKVEEVEETAEEN